jgi:hypothetical protein
MESIDKSKVSASEGLLLPIRAALWGSLQQKCLNEGIKPWRREHEISKDKEFC